MDFTSCDNLEAILEVSPHAWVFGMEAMAANAGQKAANHLAHQSVPSATASPTTAREGFNADDTDSTILDDSFDVPTEVIMSEHWPEWHMLQMPQAKYGDFVIAHSSWHISGSSKFNGSGIFRVEAGVPNYTKFVPNYTKTADYECMKVLHGKEEER